MTAKSRSFEKINCGRMTRPRRSMAGAASRATLEGVRHEHFVCNGVRFTFDGEAFSARQREDEVPKDFAGGGAV
jgi:hypothetical protein